MLFKLIEGVVARRFPERSIADVKAEIAERHESMGKAIAQRYTCGNMGQRNYTPSEIDSQKQQFLDGVKLAEKEWEKRGVEPNLRLKGRTKAKA